MGRESDLVGDFEALAVLAGQHLVSLAVALEPLPLAAHGLN